MNCPFVSSDESSVSLRPHDEEINKARIVRTAMINFFIRVVFSLSGSKIDISTPEAVMGSSSLKYPPILWLETL